MIKERSHPSIKILEDAGNKLIVEAEVIHAGRTRNNTIYPEEELAAAAETFTSPYLKPVLRHHMMWKDAIGRTIAARFTPSGIHNVPAIVVTAEITDPDAIEKVRDGRYHMISIGADAQEVYCSICGKNLVQEGWWDHEHLRGEEYDGKVAGWILRKITFEEWSYVNQPSDVLAGNIRVGEQFVGRPANFIPSRESAGWTMTENGLMVPAKEDTVEYKIPFVIKERRDAYRAHAILHEWFNHPSKTKYSPDEIREEHRRVVAIMLNNGWGHPGGIKDRLDRQLPEHLIKLTLESGSVEYSIPPVTATIKGGTLQSMKTEEQLRVELEAVQEELNSVNKALEKLQAEHASTKEDLAKAQEKVRSLEASLSEAHQKLATTEASLRETQEANEALVSELTQALAERIADYRIVLGRAGANEREQLVEQLSKRSLNSLKDTLFDMREEWQAYLTRVPHVERQGLANPDEPNVVFPSKISESSAHEKKLDEKTAVVTLFSGLRTLK